MEEVQGRVTRSGADANPVPDLEVVDVPRESSFKAWAHGYPFRTVRWHFHPEYEIHLVTETSGRAFIGDYIGTFSPGNLVMTGPNLPHNWISDLPAGEVVERRGIVIQFTSEFIDNCGGAMPELHAISDMLATASSGIEFTAEAGARAWPIMEVLLAATGLARVAHFFELLSVLRDSDYRQLASDGFRPRPEMYARDPLNHVIDHIGRNLCEELSQNDLAALSGYSPTAFSRAFRKHTGLTFVRYVNRLRIDRACELLASTDDSIADICFQVGFNNLSNFNRHFLAIKKIAPSAFRREFRDNARTRFDGCDWPVSGDASPVRDAHKAHAPPN